MTKYCYFPQFSTGVKFEYNPKLKCSYTGDIKLGEKYYYNNTFIFELISENELKISHVFDMHNQTFQKVDDESFVSIKKIFNTAWQSVQNAIASCSGNNYKFNVPFDKIEGYIPISEEHFSVIELRTKWLSRQADISSRLADLGYMKNKIGHVDQHSHVNAWYSNNDINVLLTHYIGGNKNIELLTAMLGTNWCGSNVLQDKLIAFNQQRVQQIENGLLVKDKVLIPVNLNNGHWVLLYIIYQQGIAELPAVHYFDPFGCSIPFEIGNALSNKQLFPTIKSINVEKHLQNDSCNCAPWVVEAGRAIIENKSIPEEEYDIIIAKIDHDLVLSQCDYPLDFSWSPSPCQKKIENLRLLSTTNLVYTLPKEPTQMRSRQLSRLNANNNRSFLPYHFMPITNRSEQSFFKADTDTSFTPLQANTRGRRRRQSGKQLRIIDLTSKMEERQRNHSIKRLLSSIKNVLGNLQQQQTTCVEASIEVNNQVSSSSDLVWENNVPEQLLQQRNLLPKTQCLIKNDKKTVSSDNRPNFFYEKYGREHKITIASQSKMEECCKAATIQLMKKTQQQLQCLIKAEPNCYINYVMLGTLEQDLNLLSTYTKPKSFESKPSDFTGATCIFSLKK